MERLTIRTNEASISFECESVGDIVRRKSKQRDWQSHRPLYTGIVISAVFCLSALRRVRRFNFLCLHGVCGARQRSLRI